MGDSCRLGGKPFMWTIETACKSKSVLLLWVWLLVAPSNAAAANLPAGFAESRWVQGLSSATAMAFAPDGRLFVCQQGGALRVVKNGNLLPAPFVSLSVNSSGERGLLGVAFDPDFATNQYVYVYYTTQTSPRYNRVSRFTANGDVAAPGSEVLVLRLNDLSGATNQNGGAIHFGIDGKLYVAVGDNANSSNSQTLANLLGKVLRINPDGTVPGDNPFAGSAVGINQAIWVLGLRNPFTFAVQPGSGRMFINDVGQGSWEEINDGIAGSNYGWPATEGYTSNSSYRSPVHAYSHSSGCAITGGTFYNPTVPQFPQLYVGQYFFSDYCGQWIRRYDPSDGSVSDFASNASRPVDLTVGPDGSLYYLARSNGSVYKVWHTANQQPQITTQPSDVSVAIGQSAAFSVTAAGVSPLSYQWQRNGSAVAGATSSTYALSSASAGDNGAVFRCVVSNPWGSDTSNGATLTVIGSTPPSGSITAPTAGTLFSGGETIQYSGSGTDTEDGTLPASAFTWEIAFHHDTHTHPFVLPSTGAKQGSFTIPTSGETSANVWYRIHLEVTDSDGLTHSSFRDIHPRTATITLTTTPPALQLTLDGQPLTAPSSVLGVVGIQRTIAAVSPQSASGKTYTFVSWSDGGSASHSIATPGSDTTYSATFEEASDGCDLNQDAAVDALDLQRLINVILGVQSAQNEDINNDGSTNAVDLQLLVNVILGTGT